jgi:hypothetical protein
MCSQSQFSIFRSVAEMEVAESPSEQTHEWSDEAEDSWDEDDEDWSQEHGGM